MPAWASAISGRHMVRRHLVGLLAPGRSLPAGLSPLEVFLMGAFVFAGGAQFAAVELLDPPGAGLRRWSSRPC